MEGKEPSKQDRKLEQMVMMVMIMTRVTMAMMAIMAMPNIHSSLLYPKYFSKLLHILTTLILIKIWEETEKDIKFLFRVTKLGSDRKALTLRQSVRRTCTPTQDPDHF